MSNASGKLVAFNDEIIQNFLKDPLYQILPNGTILSRVARTGKVFLDPNKWREIGNINGSGYVEICYKYRKLGVHRVVYAKYGEKQLDMYLVIHHKDSNPLNNDISNLDLVTQKDNSRFKYV